ncbi:MAG: hypothetical protein ACK5QX_03500, partial [bacterium]
RLFGLIALITRQLAGCDIPLKGPDFGPLLLGGGVVGSANFPSPRNLSSLPIKAASDAESLLSKEYSYPCS